MEKITEEDIEKNKSIVEENKYKFIKIRGKGGFGFVNEVQKDDRTYAFKIVFPIEKKNSKGELIEKILKTELVKEFRGRNLIKILQEGKGTYNNEDYYFYVMEFSCLGDINKFREGLNDNLIFKEPFENDVGDNLIRYFTLQLVNAIKTLYQGDLVHFDIKPDNILMFLGLETKLIDFSFLRKLDPEKPQIIPGGTPGYLTPEYFNNSRELLDNDTLRKQDYFALGATLYNLKYGKIFIDNYKDLKVRDNNDYNLYNSINYIQRAMNTIRSQPFQDKEFDDFLCNLVQYVPEERPDFENIIRNKWLNRNAKEIKKIVDLNGFDEDNLLLELRKSDFIIDYEEKYRKDFDGKKKENKTKYKYTRKGKFSFGKKSKK